MGFLILLAVILASMGPVGSRLTLAGIKDKELREDPNVRFKIYRAKRLDPWNPRVELARAAWLREELTRAEGWNENLYQRAVNAYLAAIELDPYDPIIALRLCDIQRAARRPEDALRTAQRGLARNPASEALMEWTFLYAWGQEKAAPALAAIDHALRVDPDSPLWWWRRYAVLQRMGQGQTAGEALHAALTAAVQVAPAGGGSAPSRRRRAIRRERREDAPPG
jgi:tetratricopeptide (TPR) repeat protein